MFVGTADGVDGRNWNEDTIAYELVVVDPTNYKTGTTKKGNKLVYKDFMFTLLSHCRVSAEWSETGRSGERGPKPLNRGRARISSGRTDESLTKRPQRPQRGAYCGQSKIVRRVVLR